MKKTLITLLVIIAGQLTTKAQDWITLTTPQSGILGAPVKEIKNGDLNFNFGLKYDKNPAIDIRESAESITEYQEKFRNFVTKYFNTSKVSLQTTNAYSLKVRSLNQEAIDNLQVGGKYVYEGISADSVTITLSAKKEFNADISKALKDISAAITSPEAAPIIEKVAPFIDSIRYERNDSVFYKITVKNPNVYYKVKVIKLKKNGNICNCDWEKRCFLYFVNRDATNDFPRTIRLENDFTGEKSTTISRYPEFCGRDRKDVQYYLKVEKDDNGLHLYVYATNANVNSSAQRFLEVPYRDNNGNREWRLNRTFLYRFDKGGVIKNVFIEVSARQSSENSLDILNWREGTNSFGDNALTALKYPEFKGKYVKK
ncbi:hypothetical protein [Flavobacterium sp.]|uniref:hypothetical protein n=1 Tax=Flavobacterium sp. TaxID=239 RepID=UPI00261636F9|nr:hypothetical protein [Flavobacterium sp.]MDD2987303.1 hypothetical protein [Flavobacterium sp.]